MEWKEWINQKYRDWQRDRFGREAGVSAYARSLGLTQQTVYSWLRNGSKPKTAKSVYALVLRYGNEVYEILKDDLPPELATPDIRELYALYEFLKRVPPGKYGSLNLAVQAWAVTQDIKIVDFD